MTCTGFFFVALDVKKRKKMIVSDKKSIKSLLNKWPKIKKSFYNDYNGDFSKVVFDVLAPHAVMMVPK